MCGHFNSLGEGIGFLFLLMCFEVREGAKLMNMLKLCVDNPYLLQYPTIYLGEGL
jgi:hypothetical protein